MRYVLARVPQAVLVVLGVMTVCFFAIRLTGDPARLMVSLEAGEEQVAAIRQEMGFDQPLSRQFVRFLARAVRGDFGASLRFKGQPAMALVLERFPATIQLAVVAVALSAAVSLVLGTLAATRRGSAGDTAAMTLALIGQAMPTFWLGILLILVFAVFLGWLPTSGRGGIEHLVLPAVTLASFSMARTTRLVRSCMLEVLSQDYIRTARSKGLRELAVVTRHALRNAAIPIVTIVGLDFGHMLGGAVITETIFSWPGVGRLAVESIYARDFPVVLAVVVVVASVFVAVNLAVDLLYVRLDPRIRLR